MNWNRMTWKGPDLLAVVSILAGLIFFGAWGVEILDAQQLAPHVFVGEVYQEGELAAEGIVVRAIIAGRVEGRTVVEDGRYNVQVSQGDTRNVWFAVGNRAANETAFWTQGGASILDLTVGDHDKENCH